MGANRICKYVGVAKRKSIFKAIACLATPFDMYYVRKGVQTTGHELCNFGLCNGIQNIIMNNYDILKQHEKEFNSDLDIDESLIQEDLISM